MNVRSVPSGTPWASMLLLFLLAGCSGVQVDTTDGERFKAGGYQTYSWLGAAIENTGNSTDPLYVIDPTLRAAVDSKLAAKGYQKVDSGGDFQVLYQFKESISEGALNSTATDANNQDIPVSSQDLLINRRADQALYRAKNSGRNRVVADAA